uniref:L-serine dehydratase/L-threonine deaminase n=1 Tax=Branchiostoma floridae TaxID=7739 RepID=C3ZL61_BRAFL|eukprot:XP_002590732.1 hypothetical protein BRAFLDRAFT_89538 [Branchiostoma floridae]
MSYKDKLYINTPLLESHPLSKHAGITVYLKLENVQPSATFKIRGISHLCQKALKEGAKHFVCSSDDERLLVEPACGAALAAIYSPVISRLQDQGRLPGGVTSVVVVVCGGNNITLKQLETWKGQLGLT